MRTIWNGSITFGLVNIPVGMALATKPAARQSDVSFRTLHRECLTPISKKRWCPTHDREVERDELVKGWEVAKASSWSSRTPTSRRSSRPTTRNRSRSRGSSTPKSIPCSSTAPITWRADREPAAQRPYVLLLRAMQETGKAALGHFVRQNLPSISVSSGPRETPSRSRRCFLAEDVNSQAEIEEAVADSKVKEAELDLARQVISSLAGEFDEADLTSEYRTNLRQMLEAKLAGQEITKPVEEPTETPVVDLMEALKRGVAEDLRQTTRQARESRPEERLSKTRSGAEEPEQDFYEASASGGREPSAWSCAAKRVLSILP